MAKKPSRILKDAAYRIRDGRWYKGSTYEPGEALRTQGIDDVKVCAYGALEWAGELPCWAHPHKRGVWTQREAFVRAMNYAREQCAPVGLAELNDYPDTTEMHMRNLFLLAAKAAEKNGE